MENGCATRTNGQPEVSGKLSRKTDPKNQSITAEYDAYGRPRAVRMFGAGVNPDTGVSARTILVDYLHSFTANGQSVGADLVTSMTDTALKLGGQTSPFDSDTNPCPARRRPRQAALAPAPGKPPTWKPNFLSPAPTANPCPQTQVDFSRSWGEFSERILGLTWWVPNWSTVPEFPIAPWELGLLGWVGAKHKVQRCPARPNVFVCTMEGQ